MAFSSVLLMLSRLHSFLFGTNEPGAARSASLSSTEATLQRADWLAREGRFADSLALADAVLRERPDAAAYYARGLTLLDWGRSREALENLLAAERMGMSGAKLYINIAEACQALGFVDEAQRRAHEAVALMPAAFDAHACLARVLVNAGALPEAISAYEQAVRLDASRVDCLNTIAACYVRSKDAERAEAASRRAIEGQGSADDWRLLGVTLAMQDRQVEAIEAFEHSRALCVGGVVDMPIVVDYGQCLIEAGRWLAAIDWYGKHLLRQPNPTGLTNYGLALLTLGCPDGWPYYEFRWLGVQAAARPTFERPRWRGQALEGKTLLLWSEQGIGDTLQFIRYATAFKQRGAIVIARVQPRLKALAAAARDVDAVVGTDEQPGSFDYHLPMLSCPYALGEVQVAAKPARYIDVDADRHGQWKSRLDGSRGLRVGLVWAGNPMHERDRFRSLPFHMLEPILRVPGLQFFSLQKERRGDEDLAAFGITDLGPHLHDFADTAAVIDNLDVVLCVDTAVAHLAGALGKPVWLMLPGVGDFRWQLEGVTSAWYPSMRLFRQRDLGDWRPVVDSVSEALRQRTHGVHEAPIPDAPAVRMDVPKPDPSLARVADTRHGVMEYDPRNADVSIALEWYGEWLQQELDVITRLVEKGGIVVDAAAHVGQHALALARHVAPAGLVFAYEADAVARQMLSENIAASRLIASVQVMRARWPWRTNGPMEPGAQPHASHAVEESVDELGLARLDLLKSTMPGAWQALLDGAANSLWKLRPIVWLAVSQEHEAVAAGQRLRPFEYRTWTIRSPLFSPTNFNDRPNDLFGGRAATALVAVPEERDAVVLAHLPEMRG